VKISLQDINSLVTPVIYKRGFRYFKEGKLHLEHVDAERIEALFR
jgi:hypothetical protein